MRGDNFLNGIFRIVDPLIDGSDTDSLLLREIGFNGVFARYGREG
jgi:hypothetical protein